MGTSVPLIGRPRVDVLRREVDLTVELNYCVPILARKRPARAMLPGLD